MVYQEETPLGKPWQSIWCEFRGFNHNFEIPKNQPYEIILPWRSNPEYDFRHIKRKMFCLQNLENGNLNDLLSKGVYSCRFRMDFLYKKNGKDEIIKDLFFELNFKIE